MRIPESRRAPDVLPVLGMLLIAAGAADGHDLVISARDSDWALLVRAYAELLGGIWLLSGRAPRTARIAAFPIVVGLFACDLGREIGSQPVRPVFGNVVVGAGWLIAVDLLILAFLPAAALRSGSGRPSGGAWRLS